MFCLCVKYIFLLFPWLCSSHGFCKHAREQYEKLSTMHKNMQKLYESIGNYFAFDPHSVSVEDFFGELASFRILFMVSIEFLLCVHVHEKSHVCCSFKVDTHTHTHTRTNRSHHPHMYIILRILWFANTHWVSLNSFLAMFVFVFPWWALTCKNVTVLAFCVNVFHMSSLSRS